MLTCEGKGEIPRGFSIRWDESRELIEKSTINVLDLHLTRSRVFKMSDLLGACVDR